MEKIHARDKNLSFQEEEHRYFAEGKELTSVTTFLSRFFPEFKKEEVAEKVSKSVNSKYFGRDVQEIIDSWDREGAEARELGTQLHAQIENYLLGRGLPDNLSKEFSQFLEFWKEFIHLNPSFSVYRLEWRVYMDKVAGSIDCVLSNKKGNLVILDWKRSKEIKKSNRFARCFYPLQHLEDCNYNHYSLQLNLYRTILEREYEKRVIGMYLVSFHPLQEKYKTFYVPRMEKEMEKILTIS